MPAVAADAPADPIPGWYSFEPFYRRAVAAAPPGSALVEVGVFCGRSLAGLARLARAAGKGLALYGVDSFRGSPEFADIIMWHDKPFPECPPGALAYECYAQLESAGVLDDVTLVVADSVRAARLFADRSVWMVMLDAGHTKEDVGRDIAAWLPKVAPGGVLAGDDYGEPAFPGVKDAVDAAFGGRVRVAGTTWEVRV